MSGTYLAGGGRLPETSDPPLPSDFGVCFLDFFTRNHHYHDWYCIWRYFDRFRGFLVPSVQSTGKEITSHHLAGGVAAFSLPTNPSQLR